MFTILYPLTVSYYLLKIGLFFWLFNNDTNLNTFYDMFVQFTFGKYKSVIKYVVNHLEIYAGVIFKITTESFKHIQDTIVTSAINRMDEKTVIKIRTKIREADSKEEYKNNKIE